MKTYLILFNFICFSISLSAQELRAFFHPINSMRPIKSYYKKELERLRFRTVYDLLRFAASEFEIDGKTQIAVLLNDDFVGQIDTSGHFVQIVDDINLLDISMDSVRYMEAIYDPLFQTSFSNKYFFGKIMIFAPSIIKISDTLVPNFYDPERIVINRSLFKKGKELASVSKRAGWFVGKMEIKNSINAGVWFELPLSQKFSLETEFSYSHKREFLSEYDARSPFEDYIYSINEWRGGVDLKYYATKRYYRPFLMVGGLLDRGTGYLQGEKTRTPPEFSGSRKGYGVRASVGVQFFSGAYFCFSAGRLLGRNANYLPFQARQGGFTVGWMLGKA